MEPCILQGLDTVKTELLRLNEECGGTGVDPAPLISNAVSNVICSLTLGQRFDHEDHEFRTMLSLMDRGLEICVNSPAVLINIFPLLYHLPFGVFKELRQVKGDITAFLKRSIASHRETLDAGNPRDLVDMYLMEILARKAAGEQDSSFTEDYLFYVIGDLFIAGTDTTANSVLWILLYMVLYPEIQGNICPFFMLTDQQQNGTSTLGHEFKSTFRNFTCLRQVLKLSHSMIDANSNNAKLTLFLF